MTMAQLTQARDEAPGEFLSLEQQNGRLLDLVGELLETNQRLRSKVAALEEETLRGERALAHVSAAFPMILP